MLQTAGFAPLFHAVFQSYATTRFDRLLDMSACRLERKSEPWHDSMPSPQSAAHVMSVYRPLKRLPRNDVFQVAEHAINPERLKPEAKASTMELQGWENRRNVAPPETLPATVRWMAALPVDFQPLSIAKDFPRIANELAALWARPEELRSYMNELLVDTRGGRRGFPVRVLRELHALRAYYSGLHPEGNGHWSDAKRKQ